MSGCLSTVAAIGMHLASWHADPGFNNLNLGGLVRYDCVILGAQPQLGTYYNSERGVTAYAALEWEYNREARVTPFLVLGAGTGYEVAPLVPIVSTGFRFIEIPRFITYSKLAFLWIIVCKG